MKKFIPNAFEQLGRKLYVFQNHPKASDHNPGTEDLPFKTISRAASVMSAYDEVIIGTGTYREEIPLKVNGHMYFPEYVPTFRGENKSEIYIKGSDVFEGKWTAAGNGIYMADLPENLFVEGIYNPYKLSAAIDAPGEVRPVAADSGILPETLGELYLDGDAMKQVNSQEQLNVLCWMTSADGKYITVNFGDRKPAEHLIELTVRKRCFRPEFAGTVFIKVVNICVEHAAEPGPFCKFRSETIRKNAASGIVIRKTFNVSGTTTKQCRLFGGEVAYFSAEDDILFAKIYDNTEPCPENYIYDVKSDDFARTWQRTSENYIAPAQATEDVFLDEALNLLIKTGIEWDKDALTASGGAEVNKNKNRLFWQISNDNGKSWSNKKYIGADMVPMRIIKLSDNLLFMPCSKNSYFNGQLHQGVSTYTGHWTNGNSDICWMPGGKIEVLPCESGNGLSEPRSVELPDGRLFLLMRMGAILPSQANKGVVSGKMYSVSQDKGKTWSKPELLTYGDGAYVYSPRSYQEIFRSRKNGRIYAVLNICDEPTSDCDPRDRLHIAEIDPQTLCIKRNTVAVVDEKHPEAHSLVRFSNWLMFEDRKTLNPILLMRQHMSEYCPVRYGYDLSSYRYEINLPEN